MAVTMAATCWPPSITLMAWCRASWRWAPRTSEIPLLTTLLDRIEITGAVITADALHAQREHARYLARAAHTM